MAYPRGLRRTAMTRTPTRDHAALLSVTLWGTLLMTGPAPAATPQPPVAEKHPHAYALHGDSIHDDFAWLRDKQDAKVIAYLDAENAYTDALTGDQQPLRQRL